MVQLNTMNEKCIFTGNLCDANLILYKWRYFMLGVQLDMILIYLNKESKKAHIRKMGTFWQFFDYAGARIMRLPILGSGNLIFVLFTLSLVLFFWLFALADIILGRSLFGRGLLSLTSNNQIKVNQS